VHLFLLENFISLYSLYARQVKTATDLYVAGCLLEWGNVRLLYFMR